MYGPGGPGGFPPQADPNSFPAFPAGGFPQIPPGSWGAGGGGFPPAPGPFGPCPGPMDPYGGPAAPGGMLVSSISLHIQYKLCHVLYFPSSLWWETTNQPSFFSYNLKGGLPVFFSLDVFFVLGFSGAVLSAQAILNLA